MSRNLNLLLALFAIADLGAPSEACEPNIAELRAELEATKANIAQLGARLSTIDGKDTADPRAQQAAAADSQAEKQVSTPSSADGGADPVWSLAPPGPIDQPLRPLSNSRQAAVELLAGSDGGRASFALTHSRDRAGQLGPEITQVANDPFSLSLSAPLAKEGDTAFATLDELATGSKLELVYTRFYGQVVTQAADACDRALIVARRRCQAAGPAYATGCTRLDAAFMDGFFNPAERDAYERYYARKTLQQSFA